MKGIHHILVTRPLSEEQVRFAEGLNMSVTVEPAIEIRYREDWDELKILLKEQQSVLFAFTSQSGVEAFRRFIETSDDFFPGNGQYAYAVGEKTAEALVRIGFIPIVPDQHDGTGLAKKIRDDFTANPDSVNSTVLHFCGDKRRDEFRQFLEGSGIEVRDVVVYQTILNSMNLDLSGIDAVLFYSPSAVHAFRNSGGFQTGSLPELFAIGPTTGQELSIESGKHVHISPETNTKTFLSYVSQILAEKSG